MKIHDCKQGSDAWLQARLGVVTASCFDRIVTSKGALSKQSTAYMDRLITERALGYPLDDGSSQFMDRGTSMESQARAWYAFDKGVEPTTVGFVTRDDGRVGCSPDALVADDGGLEIKCPAAHTHVGYRRDPSQLVAKYRCQVQGSLWITGREWWDMLSFHPTMEPLVVHVERDEAFIANLAEAIDAFLKQMDEAEQQLNLQVATPPRDEEHQF